jgi:hypothetical protein
MDRRLVSIASLSRSSRLRCSMNCKVSHIVVSSSQPKVSLSGICCRGQGHQHAILYTIYKRSSVVEVDTMLYVQK